MDSEYGEPYCLRHAGQYSGEETVAGPDIVLIDSDAYRRIIAELREVERSECRRLVDSLGDADRAALVALDTARRACNAADTQQLASELDGAYGHAARAFRSAAECLLGALYGAKLCDLIIDNGESVDYNLRILADYLEW